MLFLCLLCFVFFLSLFKRYIAARCIEEKNLYTWLFCGSLFPTLAPGQLVRVLVLHATLSSFSRSAVAPSPHHPVAPSRHGGGTCGPYVCRPYPHRRALVITGHRQCSSELIDIYYVAPCDPPTPFAGAGKYIRFIHHPFWVCAGAGCSDCRSSELSAIVVWLGGGVGSWFGSAVESVGFAAFVLLLGVGGLVLVLGEYLGQRELST